MDIVIIDNQDTLARLIPTDGLTVHFFDDPLSAFRFMEICKPAIVFVGFELLGDEVFHYIEYIYRIIPDKSIILTASHSQLGDECILDCLSAGARGYLEHADAERFIGKLIGAVMNGEAWVSRRLVAKLLQRLHDHLSEASCAS